MYYRHTHTRTDTHTQSLNHTHTYIYIYIRYTPRMPYLERSMPNGNRCPTPGKEEHVQKILKVGFNMFN